MIIGYSFKGGRGKSEPENESERITSEIAISEWIVASSLDVHLSQAKSIKLMGNFLPKCMLMWLHSTDVTFVLTEQWLGLSSAFSSPCQHDQWECSSLKNMWVYTNNKIIPKLYYVFKIF